MSQSEENLKSKISLWSRKYIKNGVFQILYSSLTLQPLSFADISDSYIPPCIHIFLCTILYALVLSFNNKMFYSEPFEFIFAIFKRVTLTWTSVVFIFNMVLCFLISAIGAQIAGFEYKKKHFSLNSGYFTFLPILFLLKEIDEISKHADFVVKIMASYYIGSSYLKNYVYKTSRSRTLHHIYIIIVSALIFTCIMKVRDEVIFRTYKYMFGYLFSRFYY